jgi:hypothetical protein
MKSDDLLLLVGFAIVVQFTITYFAVKWANNSTQKDKYMAMQISLLARIAKQSGVPSNEVDRILGTKIDWKRMENTEAN